jgi:DNA-binding NarL/FixJ family response regulator
MINLVLAEDHKIVRDGIKLLLQKDPDFNIVAEAANGKEIIDILQDGKPVDVVLTDLNMPVMSGHEVTNWIKTYYPNVRVIILSALDNDKYVINAFKQGACGYLLKSVSAPELHFAIKQVMGQNHYICSEITQRYLNRMTSRPEAPDLDLLQGLNITDLEVEILDLLADGYIHEEIAAKLLTSKQVIDDHHQQLIDRTGARNTAALVKFAFINGIIN